MSDFSKLVDKLLRPITHSDMLRRMYDITTIEGLISALGGDTVLAGDLGITQPAVANWKVRGEIPGAWHMRLLAKALSRGLTVDTLAVFGLPAADATTINRALAGNFVVA